MLFSSYIAFDFTSPSLSDFMHAHKKEDYAAKTSQTRCLAVHVNDSQP